MPHEQAPKAPQRGWRGHYRKGLDACLCSRVVLLGRLVAATACMPLPAAQVCPRPRGCPPEFYDLMQRCWSRDPARNRRKAPGYLPGGSFPTFRQACHTCRGPTWGRGALHVRGGGKRNRIDRHSRFIGRADSCQARRPSFVALLKASNRAAVTKGGNLKGGSLRPAT